MKITGGPFTGIAPRYATHLLPATAATLAKNCMFSSGELRPLRAPVAEWTPTKAGTIVSIWRYLESFWFHWTTDVDVVNTPIASDPHKRAYWTGDGVPKMTTETLATVGAGTDYPLASFPLGIPAPVDGNKPTVSAGAPSDPQNIESRAYTFTYVSSYGEEGPPVIPSEVFDTTDGDSVTVTLPGGAPTGYTNIVSKNVYRLNNGVYQFLATIAVATTSYVDTVLSASLGSESTSTDYDPPPSDLTGLIALPCGSLAGFSGNTLCFSEPYLPHAWPVKYQINFFGDIVSLGAFGNSVLVTTATEKPYIVSGDHPSTMIKAQMELGYACMSKRGTVDMGAFIVFPSPAGLIAAGTGTMEPISKVVIDERDWVTWADPSLLLAFKYGENYVGLSSTYSFMFNLKTGDLSTIDIVVTAGYTDPGDGSLYLVVDGDIVKFDAGAALEMEWVSKDFLLNRSTNFSRGVVRAEGYPVTFELYGNDVLLKSRQVLNNDPFTLPGGKLHDEFRYRIVSSYTVKTVGIANSVGEL